MSDGTTPRWRNPYAPAAHDTPGPLDNMAHKLPASAPGTLFGFPVAKLRDPAIQRKILFLAGVALVASIVVPLMTSPLTFPFSKDVPKWDFLIWPLIAGAAYLLVAAAPPDLRAKVPPAVMHWIPFAVSFAGVFMVGGFGGEGAGPLGGHAVRSPLTSSLNLNGAIVRTTIRGSGCAPPMRIRGGIPDHGILEGCRAAGGNRSTFPEI